MKQQVTTLGEGIWVTLGRQSPGRTWEIHTECGLGVCVCDIKESGNVLPSLPVGTQQAQGVTRHSQVSGPLHKWLRRKASQGLEWKAGLPGDVNKPTTPSSSFQLLSLLLP